MKKLSPLQQLARSHGVQTSFVDNTGQEQFASDETLRLILDRLRFDQFHSPIVEPVIVSWQKAKSALKTQLAEKPQRIELHLEGKSVALQNFRVRNLAKAGFNLELPLADLPTGYH